MSIGETLEQARHQAGLSVAQVSEQTRIRPPIIRSIEADDYEACGGDFYARGDIRSIAEVVGTDPEPLIQEYDEAHRAPGPVAATSLDELLRALPAAVAPPAGIHAGVRPGGDRDRARFRRLPDHGQPGDRAGPLRAADGSASPTPAASGAAGRPDAARSPRATAGSSAPAAAQSGQAEQPVRRRPAPAPTPTPAQRARPHVDGPGERGRVPPAERRGTIRRTRTWPSTAGMAPPGAPTGTPAPSSATCTAAPACCWTWASPVTVTGIRVTLGAAAGAHFQIRVGDQPHLGALRPVAGSAGPGGIVRLGLNHPTRGRYVLVWFTELPRDPAGTYQAAIYGIGVKGQP